MMKLEGYKYIYYVQPLKGDESKIAMLTKRTGVHHIINELNYGLTAEGILSSFKDPDLTSDMIEEAIRYFEEQKAKK